MNRLPATAFRADQKGPWQNQTSNAEALGSRPKGHRNAGRLVEAGLPARSDPSLASDVSTLSDANSEAATGRSTESTGNSHRLMSQGALSFDGDDVESSGYPDLTASRLALLQIQFDHSSQENAPTFNVWLRSAAGGNENGSFEPSCLSESHLPLLQVQFGYHREQNDPIFNAWLEVAEDAWTSFKTHPGLKLMGHMDSPELSELGAGANATNTINPRDDVNSLNVDPEMRRAPEQKSILLAGDAGPEADILYRKAISKARDHIANILMRLEQWHNGKQTVQSLYPILSDAVRLLNSIKWPLLEQLPQELPTQGVDAAFGHGPSGQSGGSSKRLREQQRKDYVPKDEDNSKKRVRVDAKTSNVNKTTTKMLCIFAFLIEPCKYRTKTIRDLIRHLRTEHGIYFWRICSYVYFDQERSDIHKSVHDRNETHCERCISVDCLHYVQGACGHYKLPECPSSFNDLSRRPKWNSLFALEFPRSNFFPDWALVEVDVAAEDTFYSDTMNELRLQLSATRRVIYDGFHPDQPRQDQLMPVQSTSEIYQNIIGLLVRNMQYIGQRLDSAEDQLRRARIGSSSNAADDQATVGTMSAQSSIELSLVSSAAPDHFGNDEQAYGQGIAFPSNAIDHKQDPSDAIDHKHESSSRRPRDSAYGGSTHTSL